MTDHNYDPKLTSRFGGVMSMTYNNPDGTLVVLDAYYKGGEDDVFEITRYNAPHKSESFTLPMPVFETFLGMLNQFQQMNKMSGG